VHSTGGRYSVLAGKMEHVVQGQIIMIKALGVIALVFGSLWLVDQRLDRIEAQIIQACEP
jgi:uncharacterized iron-regulated membrane protein